MSSPFPSIPEVLPEGQCGIAKVQHFEVSKADSDFTSIRAMFSSGGRGEYVPPGKYAQLFVGRELMMSDTSMERQSNREVVRQAHGHVFIAGLGLGMILHPILNNPTVTKVTVVEKYADVIRLVAHTLPHQEKLEVIEADVLDWKPAKGTKYDVVYFDIWPTICIDNLEQMALLHRRFAHFKAPGAWMNSWLKADLQDRKRRNAMQRRTRWF